MKKPPSQRYNENNATTLQRDLGTWPQRTLHRDRQPFPAAASQESASAQSDAKQSAQRAAAAQAAMQKAKAAQAQAEDREKAAEQRSQALACTIAP